MAQNTIAPPYLKKGPDTRAMMLWMLACLTLTALHYSVRFYPAYFLRFALCMAAGGLVEMLYMLLKDSRPGLPSPSTFVTAALFSLSLPAGMPWPALLSGILVAVLFGKLIPDKNALRVNPMLLGRLFVMLVFADLSQQWLIPGARIDAITSSTPLGLYAAEKHLFDVRNILSGNIAGNWEGIYTVIPGAPGEVFPVLPFVCGILLYLAGVLDWRPAVFYLAGMAAGCLLFKMPFVFNMLGGATFFTAAYIITDPRTTPASKAGRILAGLTRRPAQCGDPQTRFLSGRRCAGDSAGKPVFPSH